MGTENRPLILRAEINALWRRYTPAVLDDIERNPHNVGAMEIRDLVRLVKGVEQVEAALRRAGQAVDHPDVLDLTLLYQEDCALLRSVVRDEGAVQEARRG